MRSDERSAKRLKSESNDSGNEITEDVTNYFSKDLFSDGSIKFYSNSYKHSEPYKHAVIPKLFDDEFLLKAREELLKLSFREKETDIYKITQSGDFSNIHLLPQEEKDELPTLLQLRNVLYSSKFRGFLRQVTGCGPLSGVKTDMSTNNYGSGCHLLNHDDVIGTRRVSFILYLPLPEPSWKASYGGALELYPLSDPPTNPTTPAPKPTVTLPPSFNQFAFFEVQPGHSFHSVEEVTFYPKIQFNTDGGVGKRISISGWFHRPVESEEEYEGSQPELTKSSLEQLYAAALRPLTNYDGNEDLTSIPSTLDDSTFAYLKEFINPMYLSSKSLDILKSKFIEESHLLLTNFLHEDLANQIKGQIVDIDNNDNVVRDKRVEKNEYGTAYVIPAHSTGENKDWKLVGPPHVQRYVSLTTKASTENLISKVNNLFASKQFRLFLSYLTSCFIDQHIIESRRFRPGLDYTLARGEKSSSETSRLDVGLNLTISDDNWNSGRVGGWDVWLNGEEDSDEATYGASNEDDDGPLLTLSPEFNRLHLVLRDPGLLHFVKYINSKATSSRWDTTGEWIIRNE